MLIEHPDLSLTNPYDIREQKTRILLKWLLAFRFSSKQLLAQVLGSDLPRSARIFNTLYKANYIQNFLNDYTFGKRFVMLTAAGAHFLEQSTGQPVDKAITKLYRMSRYPNILHDLAVQRAALRRLDKYVELIFDHDITIPEPLHRPDMLMKNHKGSWVAFEYERTRKFTPRIFISFYNHAEAMIERHYNATYFLFNRESDAEHYNTLFDAKEWPRYDYNRGTGKAAQIKVTFQPDTVTNLRKCFLFIVEPQDGH